MLIMLSTWTHLDCLNLIEKLILKKTYIALFLERDFPMDSKQPWMLRLAYFHSDLTWRPKFNQYPKTTANNTLSSSSNAKHKQEIMFGVVRLVCVSLKNFRLQIEEYFEQMIF